MYSPLGSSLDCSVIRMRRKKSGVSAFSRPTRLFHEPGAPSHCLAEQLRHAEAVITR